VVLLLWVHIMTDTLRFCPLCQGELELVYEEVDIGVGVQRYAVGAICKEGHQFSICNTCGRLDVEECTTWCKELR
jgi:uncharacterized protein with PIN domain